MSFDGGLPQVVAILADFVFITTLVYIILRALRHTPALPFLLSLAVLGFVYVVISMTGLHGSQTIFSYAPQWLAIAIIVLFQEDIRRLIRKVNPNNILNKLMPQSEKAKQAQYELIGVLVKASTTLSSKGLGALIVVDMEQDLGDYEAGGVLIDSVLSAEILHAIFIDRFANPLHDGATIINADRIKAAACFLPLTTKVDIDPTLGTRHRAGIGLSEETGALVVIVSEETRKLTVCKEGRYWRFSGTESDEFRGKLQEHLLPRERAKESAPKERNQ